MFPKTYPDFSLPTSPLSSSSSSSASKSPESASTSSSSRTVLVTPPQSSEASFFADPNNPTTPECRNIMNSYKGRYKEDFNPSPYLNTPPVCNRSVGSAFSTTPSETGSHAKRGTKISLDFPKNFQYPVHLLSGTTTELLNDPKIVPRPSEVEEIAHCLFLSLKEHTGYHVFPREKCIAIQSIFKKWPYLELFEGISDYAMFNSKLQYKYLRYRKYDRTVCTKPEVVERRLAKTPKGKRGSFAERLDEETADENALEAAGKKANEISSWIHWSHINIK